MKHNLRTSRGPPMEVMYTSVGIRMHDKIKALASTPSRPLNPTLTRQKQASPNNNKHSKVPKTQKTTIFSYQKIRVPNKIEARNEHYIFVTSICIDPEKEKYIKVLLSGHSSVKTRCFSTIAVSYIYLLLLLRPESLFVTKFWGLSLETSKR